jgi:hypothetical protein
VVEPVETTRTGPVEADIPPDPCPADVTGWSSPSRPPARVVEPVETTHSQHHDFQEHTMYDMYPEWGPSRHYGDATAQGGSEAVQAGLDLRDNGGQRPDDN